MVKAQEWLDENCPLNERNGIRELDISNSDLKGSLFLTGFTNLEKLDCSRNKLTNLDVKDCSKLREIWCGSNRLTSLNLTGLNDLEEVSFSNNLLTNFDYSVLNPEKLITLSIRNNNLHEQDLSVFSEFTNLEALWIGNDNQEHLVNNLYNKFVGSLEPLKKLSKLKKLHIANTDLNSGYECLPASIKKIYCSFAERPASKVQEVAEQLKWIGKGFDGQKLKEWIDVGFQPKECGFACYLTKKGYSSFDKLNLEELKKEYLNAQNWLDINYPKEERSRTYEVHIREQLTGQLDLSDFVHEDGVKIYISYSIDESQFQIIKPEGVEIIKFHEAQKWLENQTEYNTREKRERVKSLEITEQLEGVLDLGDFTNLWCIYLFPGVDEKQFRIRNIETSDIDRSVGIIKLIAAQQYLETNYPQNDVCQEEQKEDEYGRFEPNPNFHKTRVEIKSLDLRRKNLTGSLVIQDWAKLEELDCSQDRILTQYSKQSQLTSLTLLNCPGLKQVCASGNQLTSLTIANCGEINFLDISENELTSWNFLISLNPKKLTFLNISKNKFPPQDFSILALVLSQFENLGQLILDDSAFFGSLAPLKSLGKLRSLDIEDTDIDSGLEYLPESIQYLNCSAKNRPQSRVKSIEWELSPYKDGIQPGKYNFPKWRDENVVKMVPTLPPSLSSEGGSRLEEGYEVKEKYYDNKIYPESSLPQEIDKNKILSLEELPTKLYSVKENKVIKEKTGVKNYAILSYVWGDNSDKNKLIKEEKEKLDSLWENSKLGYENKVNRLGYKSWQKAIEACQHPNLSINYLWMDQLCINQSDNEEKEQEVPKMRQYYSNAAVTLIGIQAKAKTDDEELDLLDILKRITCSEWFTRSWTFQEGWLSKWTIFMFDDILVDGRQMAALWVFQQPSHIGINFSKSDEGTKKVATPIGWVYYKGKDEKGYKSADKVSLRLYEALREIKNRGRGNPVDGIYSILGLLPYGDKVKVEYKPRECSKCEGGVETKNCNHEEKYKKWATYDIKELEDRLFNVMKVALQNGYGELLSWHGLGNGWLPKVNGKGSTSIEGGIKIDYVSRNNEEIFQPDGSLRITGSEYSIIKVGDTMSRWDQSSSIESGARERKVWIDGKKEIELLGTREILSSMNKLVKEEKNNICLLVPNKYQWQGNRPFAIITEIEGGKHYGLGLVEISEGAEKLRENEKEITIWKKQNNWLNEEKNKKEELQARIQRWKDELKSLQQQIADLPSDDQEELLAQIQIPPK